MNGFFNYIFKRHFNVMKCGDEFINQQLLQLSMNLTKLNPI